MSSLQTIKLIYIIIALYFGAQFPYGFSQAVLNTPERVIKAWINETLPSTVSLTKTTIGLFWGFIMVVGSAGTLCGTFAVFPLSERFGRRDIILMLLVPSVVSHFMGFVSFRAGSVLMFVISRFLMNACIGATAHPVNTLIMECAPIHLRGRFGVTSSLIRELGSITAILLGNVVALGTPSRWHYLLLVPIISYAVHLSVVPFIHKSPRWIYAQSQDLKAVVESLLFYQNDPRSIEQTLYEMTEGINRYSTRPTISEFLSRKAYWMPIAIAVIYGAMLGFSGRRLLVTFSSHLFAEAGLSLASSQTAAAFIQIVTTVGILLNMLAVDHLGRRPILKFATITVATLQAFIIAAFIIRASSSYALKELTMLIVVLVAMWLFVATGSLLGLAFVPSELYPQCLRSPGQSLEFSTLGITNAITMFVFEPLQAAFPTGGLIFMFFPFILFSHYLLHLMPETRNRSLEAITLDLETVSLMSWRTKRKELQLSDGTPFFMSSKYYDSLPM